MNTTTPKNSLALYLRNLKNDTPLSAEEENKLMQAIRKGDNHAKEKFVQTNLRFVITIARRYHQYGVPLEDLISAGNLGLLMAVERFDATRGFKFISYATWWIRNLILQTLSEQAWMVRLPTNRLTLLRRLTKLKRKHPLTHLETHAEDLGVSTEQIRDTLNQARTHRSLYEAVGDKDKNTLLDILPDHNQASPDDTTLKNDLQKKVKQSLNALENREAMVLRLFFGFDTQKPQTLSAIGRKLHLSRERVRQIKEKALTRLRHPKYSNQLVDLLETQ